MKNSSVKNVSVNERLPDGLDEGGALNNVADMCNTEWNKCLYLTCENTKSTYSFKSFITVSHHPH